MRRRLVEYLEAIPSFRAANGRHLLFEHIRDQLSFVQIHDDLVPRLQWISLVDQCSRKPGGLSVLTGVMEFMAPDDPSLVEIASLTEQLEMLSGQFQLAELWDGLEERLLDVPIGDAQAIILHVARIDRLPGDCRDSWSGFRYLLGSTAPPGRALPPWVGFLELVRDQFDQTFNEQVRLRLRRISARLDRTSELEGIRSGFNARKPPLFKDGILVLSIHPNYLDPDEFTVSTARRWRGQRSSSPTEDSVVVNRKGLSGAVERLVRKAEAGWAEQATTLSLEFVLPLPLLNEPVEWWSKNSGIASSAPLAVHHPIVLRSLERAQGAFPRRTWRSRWQRLNDANSAGHMHVCARDSDLRQLEAVLSEDLCVGAILSAPPTAVPDQEIMAAFRVGIPIILWNRSGGVRGDVSELASDLCQDILRIPERLTELRKQSERLPAQERDAHPVRGISLLWDDADHAPDVSMADATTAGGS